MPLFGPETYQQPSQWNTILSGVSQKPALLALPNQAKQVGSGATGEFGWVYQDPGTTDNLTVQQNFLANEAPKFSTSLGVAYAGYNDYYAQGNAGAGSGFTIASNNGQTLASTLAQDQTYSNNISAIQVATWNDYGEGTQIEPTVQDGFTNLQKIQAFTGVPYGLSQLQLVYQLYEARVELTGNAAGQSVLNQVSSNINQLDFTEAHASLAAAVASVPATLATVNALTLTGTAGFDLENQHLIINYAAGSDPAATIRAYLIAGRNGGSWNGPGIQSSFAAANSSYALGYADSGDPGDPAGLPLGTIEVMYTLLGDANLDGIVSGADFTILATNIGRSVTGWDKADFNYDGIVSGADFTALVANLGKQANGAAVELPASDYAAIDAFAAANGLLADVPEPATIYIMLVGIGTLSRRRR
jgi:hypothetical protein